MIIVGKWLQAALFCLIMTGVYFLVRLVITGISFDFGMGFGAGFLTLTVLAVIGENLEAYNLRHSANPAGIEWGKKEQAELEAYLKEHPL